MTLGASIWRHGKRGTEKRKSGIGIKDSERVFPPFCLQREGEKRRQETKRHTAAAQKVETAELLGRVPSLKGT
jgi:hypothetical protein